MRTDLEQHIKANIKEAINRGYIQPYYQPVIRTISRKLCSFEALARWIDPDYGMIRPDQFIPVLEANHSIHLLDLCVIRQVCARIRDTIEAGAVPIPVSINLSRLDFVLCDIFKAVNDIVAYYQIPHDFLYIEITESVMAEQERQLHDTVDQFRRAGYQIWMDDFGSAYSSLNLLKDFEFNEIKMDMRFLSSFDLRSRRILTAVVQMAKEIEIQTLAEGVETQEQFRYLRNIGCEKVQGFYFGKPMPYEDSLAHMKSIGVEVEPPQDRKYYDDIGKINLLSAVPFMTKAEHDALKTARQLNSIPLCIAEGRRDSFSVLFYNTAFENTAAGTGLVSNIFTQELLRVPQSYDLLPRRFLNLMDSTRSGEEGRMYFIANDDYYEIQAKCIAQTRDAYSVLFRMSNLSKVSQSAKTDHLDEELRDIYKLYERITLIDIGTDTITPLYVATREDLLSARNDVDALGREYARKWIFSQDQDAYMRHVDFTTIETRLHESGHTYVTGCFRSYTRHGQYAWKEYTIVRLQVGLYVELIRNVHSQILSFLKGVQPSRAEGLSPELLWNNLIRSDIIRIFWKDVDRRFLGAGKGFLDYYGFDSTEDIIGKTDEDLGWHIHPDAYMNDELQVLQEGRSTYNIPGRCMNNGENREIIASKTPLYDENGEITGLMGFFKDKELLAVNDHRGAEPQRKDRLTGLLNSRGISEEAHTFEDEYNLRNIDFVRMHIAIDDFASINRQYGFDFGDRAITALGQALRKEFGHTCALGRYTGHQFVLLHQIRESGETSRLRDRVKEIASSILEIDGTAFTFYISVGYCVYSECGDLEEQTQKAEVRLLADHDDHSSVKNKQSHASELFHLYDRLPISYSVYKVQRNEEGKIYDAVLFYCNHAFAEQIGMASEELLGQRTSKLFDFDCDPLYDIAGRAAFSGDTIRKSVTLNGKDYYITASPVIHIGYCCFTCQEQQTLSEGTV